MIVCEVSFSFGHSLRAQADKAEYSRAMRKVLENQENLLIKQAEVCELLWEETEDHKKKITGLKTFTGLSLLHLQSRLHDPAFSDPVL